MSVDASKWARMADVQKSSSKLVLLSLAQLVRYDAEQWTVFASIDYLAKVTHLNRKTVIEALARLRDLGAIKDTGRRAGDNRSSIIYQLSPKGVPLIDMAISNVAAGGAAVQTMPQQDLNLGFDADTPQEQGAEQASDSPPSPASAAETLDNTAPCPDSAQHHSPADDPERSRAGVGRTRQKNQPVAGAGPTRLPAAWTLPDRWRMWVQRERPLWSAEKVDAMAATFSAYMRSRPGELGMSADWFESWRLWVFRERESQEARQPWHATWSGIVAKGRSLGLDKAPNEPEPYFKARVFCAAGLSLPQ